MANIDTLIDGYRRFYKRHFVEDKALYQELSARGQSPKTLVIACSDSRVDPSIITDANSGDIFVVRNVANIVPPFQPEWGSYHGTSAALEFAIAGVGVEHIIVLGHSGCAGIKTLVDTPKDSPNEGSFIRSWMGIAEEALEVTEQKCLHSEQESLCRYTTCEQEAILVSLRNLMTFPWVKVLVKDKKVSLHGWYFSVKDGSLSVCNLDSKGFEKVVV